MKQATFTDLLNYSIQQHKTPEEILEEASRMGLYTETASARVNQAVEDGLIKSSTTGDEKEFTLDEDPTEAQAKSYKFAERMNVVNADVEEAEAYIQKQTGWKSGGFALDVAQTRGDIPFVPGSITNQMADPKVRKAIQAQDAWMEANLRDTSGATIKEEEYEMNRPTYFAQPGDSEEILKSKKKLRETAMISTYEASGATKQQAQSLVNGEVPPEAPEVKEQSEDVRNKLDSMYEWAKNNPDDPAGKEFLTDWENDNIDFNTGELIQPRPETMTPSQRKAYEQNQAVQKAEAKKAQALETQQVQPQATNQEETKKQYNETLTAKTLDKIGDFTGMKKFGEGIGATTFLMTKEGRDLMDKAESGDKIAVDTMNSILEDAPNTKEVIGSALMTALNAVSGGVAGKVKSATMGAKVAKGAVTGGAYGLAGGLEQDKDAKGIAKSTAIGAGVGASIPLATAGIKKAGRSVASRLYSSGVPPKLEDAKKAIQYGGKTLSDDLLDEGIKGNNKKLLVKAQTGLKTNETKLQKILDKSDETIQKKELLPYLKKLKTTLKNTPTKRAQGAVDKVDDAINYLPDEMTLSEANVQKRNLYRELRDIAYKLDPNLSADKKATKAIAGGLKDLIETKSGNPEVANLNQKLAMFGKLEDSATDSLARTMRNKALGVGTIGAMIEKVLLTTGVKTYSASVIDKVTQSLANNPNVTEKTILHALREASDNN